MNLDLKCIEVQFENGSLLELQAFYWPVSMETSIHLSQNFLNDLSE